MNTQLDDFEAALLHELREHVATRPAPSSTRTTTLRAVAGLGIAAAAATAVVVLVPGAGVEPAYSVQEGNSGEVVVEVNRPEEAAGLEQALQEHGIAADVTYVPDGGQCAPGRYTPVTRGLPGLSTTLGEDRLVVVLPPGSVRDGETFVLAVSLVEVPGSGDGDGDGVLELEGSRGWMTAEVASGPVRPCQVVAGGR